MKVEIRLPIPNVTKSYRYGYEQKINGYAKAIIKTLHGGSKAVRKIKNYNFIKPKEGYDNIKGEYLYYDFCIESDKPDKIIWLNN